MVLGGVSWLALRPAALEDLGPVLMVGRRRSPQGVVDIDGWWCPTGELRVVRLFAVGSFKGAGSRYHSLLLVRDLLGCGCRAREKSLSGESDADAVALWALPFLL